MEDSSKRMVDIIMEATGPDFTMLVVPDYHSRGRLDRFPGFCAWLRELETLGVEMALHGLTHRSSSGRQPLSGKLLTDGEGEFFSRSAVDAAGLIRTGHDILSLALGKEPEGFTAPAWLYSRGTEEALRSFPFRWIEHRSFVDYREKGTKPSPVIVFASRTPWKRFCSRIWAGTGPLLFTPAVTVRVGLHVKDFTELSAQSGRTLSLSGRGRVFKTCGAGATE